MSAEQQRGLNSPFRLSHLSRQPNKTRKGKMILFNLCRDGRGTRFTNSAILLSFDIDENGELARIITNHVLVDAQEKTPRHGH